MKQLVEYIKEYALEHYNDGGWDVLVECWSDTDIENHLTVCSATTEAESLAAFKDIVSVWADQQADARNSAF
jgi:hypothetical protein